MDFYELMDNYFCDAFDGKLNQYFVASLVDNETRLLSDLYKDVFKYVMFTLYFMIIDIIFDDFLYII